jgi:S-adenosylmethionine decarboxylase
MISTPTERKDPMTLMTMWGRISDFDPGAGRGFEGPEKRLEIIMRCTSFTDPQGLRSLSEDVWRTVVGSLNAQIVSSIRNETIQSYVLTESSLFVTATKIILITCGTTTLLNAIPHILQAISAVRGEPEWASFMHKNYSYPWEQKGPHTSMAEECKVLKQHFPKGKPFIFGPVDSDHYFFFCFDDVIRPGAAEDDTQMSLTMYGLDKAFTAHFFSENFIPTSAATAAIRSASNLQLLVPDESTTPAGEQPWQLHDLQFAPCGYSINAIRGDEYQTMHITPEDHCSFASYETNAKTTDLSGRMRSVLSVFKPQRFTIVVVLDPQSAVGMAHQNNQPIGVEQEFHKADYCLLNRTVNEFEPGYVAMKLNFARWGDPLIESS